MQFEIMPEASHTRSNGEGGDTSMTPPAADHAITTGPAGARGRDHGTAAPEGFALIDGRGVIVSASEGFAAALGHPAAPDQLSGRTLGSLLARALPAPDAEAVHAWMSEAAAGSAAGCRVLRLHRDEGLVLNAQRAEGMRTFLHVRRAPAEDRRTDADATAPNAGLRHDLEPSRLLEALLRHIPYFVFWKDRNLVYQGCSQNFADVFAAGSREDVIGATNAELLPNGAEAGAFRRGDMAVLEGGMPHRDVHRIVHPPDGTPMHWLTSTVALRDQDGAVTGVLSVARDVTAARRTEAERNRLSQVMQALRRLPVVVLRTDDSGTVTESLGAHVWGDREAEGRDVFQLLPGAAVVLRDSLTQRRTVHFETADHRHGWALDMVFGPDRPGGRGFLGVGLDVSGRRRAEARFQAVFENMTLGLALLDEHGVIIAANSALCRILDKGAEDLTGRAAADLLPLPEPGAWRSWREVVGGREAGAPPPPWLRIGRHAFSAGVAEDAASILMVEDSSEVRALEDQLAHLSKLTALGEMAASLAHEINQPLNIARLVAEAALEDIAGNDSPLAARLGKGFATIHDQSQRIVEIIQHVRQFARREEGRPRPFDPVAVSRTVVKLFRHEARKARVTLDADLPQSGPLILGHTVRFEQVLINLLSNAVDAARACHGDSGAGRVTLSVRVEDGTRTVVLSVADNGSGIPESVRDRVFEPFFTTKPAEKGSGLGLAICLTIVAEMNGRIDLLTPDEGARVEVRLPIPETPPLPLRR